jgi:ADP-ribose pyrophosphatase YjhB (NUDIX family)
MGFDDRYRVSAHAVVMDDRGRILLLKPSYGDGRWGLPGGSAEPGEHLLDTLQREMVEELGCVLEVERLVGMFVQPEFDAHVAIFRGALPSDTEIVLSDEHVMAQWFEPDVLGDVASSDEMAHLLRRLAELTGDIIIGELKAPGPSSP